MKRSNWALNSKEITFLSSEIETAGAFSKVENSFQGKNSKCLTLFGFDEAAFSDAKILVSW